MSSSYPRGARIATAIACLFVSPLAFSATDPITIDGSYEGNPDNHPDTLWISHSPAPHHDAVVTSLNSTTGNTRFDIALTDSVQAFAVDPQTGNLWLYTAQGLQGYTPTGEPLLPAPVLLPQPEHGRGFKDQYNKVLNLTPEQIQQFQQRSQHPSFKLSAKTGDTTADAKFWRWWTTSITAIQVDGKTGIIWLAQGDTLHRIALNGSYLGKTQLPQHINYLTLDTNNGQLWAATRNNVHALLPTGQITATIQLHRRNKIRDIAYAPVIEHLLVLTRRQIGHYAANGQLLAQSDNLLRPAARFIAPDGQGGLWLANVHEVAYQTKAQVLTRNIAFSLRPFSHTWPPGGPITHLQADPGDHSAWVAGFFAAQQIHTDASLGFGYKPQSGFRPERINAIALYADITPPEIFILNPLADSFTNDNTPAIELAYVDIGSAVDPESIKLTIDDKAITATCLPEPLSAVCTPTNPLLDGYLHLIATVADYAFNESEPDDVWFTVDTIPPKIIINDTTHNGFTNQPAHTISGQIDELHLAALSINGQTVDVDANNNFAYSVTLIEGENTFVVHATDLAGNSSEIIHTVILDTIPPVITVNPDQDITTNQSEIILTGSINEPATLMLNGHPLSLNKSIAFTTTRSLDEGGNRFGFKATDRAWNVTHLYRTITKDTTPPPAPNPGRISVSEPDENGVVTITGQAGSVAPNSWVIVSVGGDGNLTIAPGEPTASIANCDANTWRVQADQYGGFILHITPGGLCPIIIVTEDPGGNRSEETTYDPQDPPVTREGIVGALPGEFSVDASGAANYKIPIEVPPGVGGMQPQLAFLYSSRAGNGQLGVGWSLSGLSAISRCPQTMATDGKKLGITLSDTDRLCLDGQRLVTAAGTYMQPGNTYYTEIASFQKVTSSGGSLETGPDSFTVVDKAGLIRTYGGDSAKINAQGTDKILLWPVRKIEDRFGNNIEFIYGQTEIEDGDTTTQIGEFWPKEIRWSNAQDTTIGKVVFTYTAREDTHKGFLYGGSKRSLTKRLAKVRIYSFGNTVYTYKLSYQYDRITDQSQLRTIQQCNAEKQCLPPTTFHWQQGQLGFGATYVRYSQNRRLAKFGDVDGDGLLDVITIQSGRVYVDEADGGQSDTIRLPKWDISADSNRVIDEGQFSNARVVDINADGFSDIIIPAYVGYDYPNYWHANQWNIFLSDGDKFNSTPVRAIGEFEQTFVRFFRSDWKEKARKPQHILPIDLNGDALIDIIGRVNGKIAIYWQNANGSFSLEMTEYPLDIEQELMPIEFNGDGRTDVLVTAQGCEVSAIQSFEDIPPDDPHDPGGGGGTGGGSGDGSSGLSCGDTTGILVNVDGQLVNGWAENRCNAGIYNDWPLPWPFPYPNPNPGSDPCAGQYSDQIELEDPILLDANGDGLTDIFDNHERLRVNTGGWFTTTWYGDEADHDNEEYIRVVDYNADGQQDILIPQNNRWELLESTGTGFKRLRATGIPDTGYKTTSFTDMNGDGLFDVLFYDNGWNYRPHVGQKVNLIDEFTNGFGENTVVNYAALTDKTAPDGSAQDLYKGHTDAGMVGGTNPHVRNIIAPIVVVSKFGVDSGANTGSSMLFTQYTYKGAKINMQGRGFLGFHEIRAVNYNTNIETINRHRQDFPYTGMVMKSIQRTPDRTVILAPERVERSCTDNLQPVSGLPGPGTPPTSVMADGCRFINIPPVTETTPGDTISKTSNTFALFEWDERYYPYVKTSTNTHYGLHTGNELKQIKTTYTYDSNGQGGTWGNPTKITVATDNGANGPQYTTTTVNQYTNNTVDWCLGRLKRATVSKTSPTDSDSRVSAFTYVQSNGPVGYKTCQLASETVEPGTAFELTKTYGFDQFGNRTSVEVSGAGITSRTTKTSYTSNGLFPDEITNALDHKQTQTWDARFGVKKSVTGPNGLTTRWTYNDLGRKTDMQAPRAAVSTEWEYNWCNQQACISEDAVWQLTQTGSDGSLAITAYDRLGRKVMSATQDYLGRMIQQATFYDIKGRPYLSSQPYFANEQASACWVYRQYDNLDRVTKSYAPASEAQCQNVRILDDGEPLVTADNPPAYGAVTTFVYDGLTTYSRDPQGRTVSRRVNVMGRLVQVAERNRGLLSQNNPPGVYQQDGVPVTTRYSYTAYGNTKTVTDAAGNTTTLHYNQRGFKVAMDAPDMGHWTYDYNVLGELISQTDAKGQIVTMAYDLLGRLIERTENEGTTTWRYGTAAGKGIGKLHTVAFTKTGEATPTFVKDHSYNGDAGELTATVQIMNGHAYWTSQAYDNFGRPQTLTYPAKTAPAVTLTSSTDGTIDGIPINRDTSKEAFKVSYQYTRSTLTAVVNPKTQLHYWHLGQSDAAGRITKSQLGNNLTTGYQYDRARGVLTAMTTGVGGSANIQNASYQWDQVGNLVYRVNHNQGFIENFAYDELYRLTYVNHRSTNPMPLNKPAGKKTLDIYDYLCNLPLATCLSYDAIGNITHKGDTYTDYAYGKPGSPKIRPHAVNAVTVQTDSGAITRQYQYDANGNMKTGGGNTITWSSYNKPLKITDDQTGYSSQFTYGPSRARYWHQATTKKGITTTWYVGGSYERVTDNTGTQHRYFVRAGGQVIAVHKEQSTASNSPAPLRGEGRGEGSSTKGEQSLATNATADLNGDGVWIEYLHRNHQGSIVAITNSEGDLLARYSYDAWGKRRSPVSWDTSPAGQFLSPDSYTTRGYTGHEHLDHLGLIHMNGRVYAPEIGRFLSPDIVVQYPESTQSWNRYAYVNNNPLTFTDPSGFFSWSEFRDKWLKPIVAIVAAVATYGAVSGYLTTLMGNSLGVCFINTPFLAAVGGGAAAGFVGGGIGSGTLEGAFKGAVTGAIFGGIGGYYHNNWTMGRFLANSTAGGISAEIHGGEFKDGFVIVGTLTLARMGWEYTREQTNVLKMKAVRDGGRGARYNKWGELLTDGTRDVHFGMDSDGQLFTKAETNFLTKAGMAAEGSGLHMYSENGWPGRWVNWTSKTHDWLNSWGYDEVGFWVSRSEMYNTVFQFYSMSGMVPAFAFTTAAMSATIPTPLIAHSVCGSNPDGC